MSFLQIQIHGSDWTSLYEQVPKEVLPTEYGGNAGSLGENWGETIQISLNTFNIFLIITNFWLIE